MKPGLPRLRPALLALLVACAVIVPTGFAAADTGAPSSSSLASDTPAPSTPAPADSTPPASDTSQPSTPPATDTPAPTTPAPSDSTTDTSQPSTPPATDTPTLTDTPQPTSSDPSVQPSDTVTLPGSPSPTGPSQSNGGPNPPGPTSGPGVTVVPPLPGGKPKRAHPHKPITTVHRLHVQLPSRPHPHRKPWPITLTIKTVPNLANVAFAFDGRWVTTDQYGVATVTEEHNLAPHTLRIGDLGQEDTGLKFRFTRWVGQRNPDQQLMTTVTGLPMRADATIYAAISVQYPATPQVFTQRGAAVLDSDISSITVRDTNGGLSVLMPGQQSWLNGVVPAFQKNVLIAQTVGYSVQSIVVRGTNTVDAGRQRFDVTKSSYPRFTALFFDLTITGRDSLFGWAMGSRATLRYPDGTTLTVNLGRQHRAVVANLPRGQYQVTLGAADSIVASAKVQLSRTMAFQARAVTVLDLLTVLASAILVAVLLLVLGRTDWAQRLIGRARPGRWARRAGWSRRGRPPSADRPQPTSPLAKL
jgi:hypothetical protein